MADYVACIFIPERRLQIGIIMNGMVIWLQFWCCRQKTLKPEFLKSWVWISEQSVYVSDADCWSSHLKQKELHLSGLVEPNYNTCTLYIEPKPLLPFPPRRLSAVRCADGSESTGPRARHPWRRENPSMEPKTRQDLIDAMRARTIGGLVHGRLSGLEVSDDIAACALIPTISVPK